MGNGGIGCWRAHLNAYQQMVQHNIQSALIFEDDADWDLVFKYQMLDVARGTRFLLNSTGPDTNSPYGDKWDILWVGMGSAQEPAPHESRRRWITPDDPTVIPPWCREAFWKPTMSFWDDHHEDQRPFTQMMFQPMSGTGMAGDAISLTGAKKMLYHQSMTPFSDSVDDGLWKFLHWREDFSNFTAVAPWPRIVASSVAAGSVEKDTDIEGHTTHGNVRNHTLKR